MLRHPLLYLVALLLLCCSLPAQAQRTTRLSGTVLKPDKMTPVPGATVIKTNTNLGVVSDEEGRFLIDVGQNDTLLIRALGFKPLLYLPSKLPVSELRVTMVLQEDSVMLGEVEITSRPSQELIDRALRNMKRETANYNMEMFARYVKPQLVDMWEDEWENKWWPKPVMSPERRELPRDIHREPFDMNSPRPVSPLSNASKEAAE